MHDRTGPCGKRARPARNLTTRRSRATSRRCVPGFDAWPDGTGSPYEALADDVTWEIVGNSVVARVYTSKEDFLSNVIRPFNTRMASPLRPTVRDMYADGDVPYRNTYSWFLSLRDNRIVKASAFFDSPTKSPRPNASMWSLTSVTASCSPESPSSGGTYSWCPPCGPKPTT